MLIGDYNLLTVNRSSDYGLYLENHEEQEVLLPNRYVTDEMVIGDQIRVFVYLDSEERLVATTEQPYLVKGQFALLKAKEVNTLGAFMDWGLAKDLFVPFSQQQPKMKTGKSYIVYLYLDEVSDRLVASSRIENFIDRTNINYEEGQEVNLLIYKESDIGYKAIINNKNEGLIYKTEVFEPLIPGDERSGFIKHIRPDGKIDLTLQKSGFAHIDEMSGRILKAIKNKQGILYLHDNSSPEEIKAELGMSKKAFKKAVGGLYKKRMINILENGIELKK